MALATHDKSGLRLGRTTGACAAAAAKAAAILMEHGNISSQVQIPLPQGQRMNVPILWVKQANPCFQAAVLKDGGDDPDCTHGMQIEVKLSPADKYEFLAGSGVGTVTKPGLQVDVGQPAINPGPRKMILAALCEVTHCPLQIEISIPGGEKLAAQTFNPRLGIRGGLSILGTTGIVRPFSSEAIKGTIRCHLGLVAALQTKYLILVPGNIGRRAALNFFPDSEAYIVEVGNEWGFALGKVQHLNFKELIIIGHPGKLGKIAMGYWQTHSKHSPPVTNYLKKIIFEITKLNFELQTTEESIKILSNSQRKQVFSVLSKEIWLAIIKNTIDKISIKIILVDINGNLLASWPKKVG